MTRKFYSLLIAVGLVSIVLIGWSDQIPIVRDFKEIIVRFGEALFIAVFLAATVDRYVKHRLGREVAKDVSPFIMGHGLPPEIQQEIREISAIEIYRTDLELDYELTEIPGQRSFMLLKASIKFRVHNRSDAPKRYRHSLFVQKPHQALGSIVQIPNAGARGVMLTASSPIDEYNLTTDLGEDDATGFKREWKRDVWIPPSTSPQTVPTFWGTTVQVLPREHADVWYSLIPTVGVTVRIKRPLWMTVKVSFGHRNDEYAIKIPPDAPVTWELQAAFLPMQSVLLDWREHPTPDVGAKVEEMQREATLAEQSAAHGRREAGADVGEKKTRPEGT